MQASKRLCTVGKLPSFYDNVINYLFNLWNICVLKSEYYVEKNIASPNFLSKANSLQKQNYILYLYNSSRFVENIQYEIFYCK